MMAALEGPPRCGTDGPQPGSVCIQATDAPGGAGAGGGAPIPASPTSVVSGDALAGTEALWLGLPAWLLALIAGILLIAVVGLAIALFRSAGPAQEEVQPPHENRPTPPAPASPPPPAPASPAPPAPASPAPPAPASEGQAPELRRLVFGLIGAYDLAEGPAVRAHVEHVLRNAGVTAIRPEKGTPFDTALHSAVSAQPASGRGAAVQIAALVRPGWQQDGEVLRPAEVDVSQGVT